MLNVRAANSSVSRGNRLHNAWDLPSTYVSRQHFSSDRSVISPNSLDTTRKAVFSPTLKQSILAIDGEPDNGPPLSPLPLATAPDLSALSAHARRNFEKLSTTTLHLSQ